MIGRFLKFSDDGDEDGGDDDWETGEIDGAAMVKTLGTILAFWNWKKEQNDVKSEWAIIALLYEATSR